MSVRFIPVLLGLLFSGCAGSNPPLTSSANLQVVSGTQLPAPTSADVFGPARPYFVGPFDKLKIDVFGIPELSQRVVQVDAGGNLSFPLVGTVNVAGKPASEIATLLTRNLRASHVRNPQVTVNLEEAVSQTVTVDGEVRQPGVYPVVGEMTLSKAVATARGLGEFAALDDVVVFRTVNSQKMGALYNLKAIRRGLYPDPQIYANDLIIVGDSPQRRMFRDFTAAAPLLTTPLILLFNRN